MCLSKGKAMDVSSSEGSQSKKNKKRKKPVKLQKWPKKRKIAQLKSEEQLAVMSKHLSTSNY